ncbi:hypothetical protein [Gracilibacillus boraciitolerans]|uniref:hypothetical protein n=1 Tax=Gracilibacillus boraciitolerans TaxID=307521 RepID=UPI001F1C1ECF|nr:hypothetical protein [Gracilibacillus boraciitolerans]
MKQTIVYVQIFEGADPPSQQTHYYRKKSPGKMICSKTASNGNKIKINRIKVTIHPIILAEEKFV